MYEHQVAGFIFGVRLPPSAEFMRKVCRGAPFVSVGSGSLKDVPKIAVDQRYGVQLATRHLLELGHRRIACISGPPGWTASKERRSGWAQTLVQASLEPDLCVDGDWTPESGRTAVSRLLEVSSQFTAIVVANDHMAMGALQALREKGIRVPEDVSIVGYDNLPESSFFHPPLTTVRHDFALQGQRSVEMLISILNHQPVESPVQILLPELVVRESTAVPTSFHEASQRGIS
ncbi:MAG: substrate-binding domain-containing protein [Verrucomicrobia bacterium]|nr:substrate-binding domain-containing protein [Verrucomicrobiota bacterium]